MQLITETFRKSDMPKMLALLAGFISTCEEDKEYILEIKERKRKRSLDANSYFWVLATKIAGVTGATVTGVYRSYIREIGGNCELLCIQDKAVERFRELWEQRGIGWVTEALPSKLEGCTNILCYYGSSTYDTVQMSRLIDLAIQDCKEHNIEYLPDSEIEKMLAAWGETNV